jgi:hypothetical protein
MPFDPTYVFLRGRHLLRDRDLEAARELLELIDHADENIRRIAQFFLHRASVEFGSLRTPSLKTQYASA